MKNYHYNKHHFCKEFKCMFKVDFENTVLNLLKVNNKDARTTEAATESVLSKKVSLKIGLQLY